MRQTTRRRIFKAARIGKRVGRVARKAVPSRRKAGRWMNNATKRSEGRYNRTKGRFF